MKTIGLIGGWGWEASAAYYRIINREVRARLGGWHSARIILDSHDLHPLSSSKSPQDYEAIRDTLLASARRLEDAGSELLVIACNTVHRFADAVEEATNIPLLHIADAAARELAKDSHQRVGLLGTVPTMQGSFYKKRLEQKWSIDVVTPPNDVQRDVGRLIAYDLTQGSNPQACAPRLDPVIEALKEEGCTAVLLACTDFGLAYGDTDAPVVERALPLYDTGVLHALAAANAATETTPAP